MEHEQKKCPFCGSVVDAEILKNFYHKIGHKGGSRSRRKLTTEQAKAMLQARAEKRKQRKERTATKK